MYAIRSYYVWVTDSRISVPYPALGMPLKPLKMLEGLALPDGGSTSFYETEGSRKDYVKNSQKPWERLLMSWWAFVITSYSIHYTKLYDFSYV